MSVLPGIGEDNRTFWNPVIPVYIVSEREVGQCYVSRSRCQMRFTVTTKGFDSPKGAVGLQRIVSFTIAVI